MLGGSCNCCEQGWYCWSCDCGLSSVSITITDFQSDNQSLFNPTVNGTYTMQHPSGVDACCEMWVATVGSVLTLTLYQVWVDDEPTLPTLSLAGANITGGGNSLSGSPCIYQDGSFSSPSVVFGTYQDPSNTVNIAPFRFKASVSGVP